MLQNREGQRVPNVTFPVREGNTWKKLTSDDIFKNKTVVVFSLPGAFTPTCSSTHLPRYNELAPAFFKEGVDSIVCVSVNDTFVMNEWARTRNRPTSRCCPTATAPSPKAWACWSTRATWVSASAAGATPCWSRTAWCRRCSSSRKRKAIPLKCRTPTPCWRTRAQGQKPDQVVVFSKPGCPFCVEAKALLQDKGFDPIEIPLENKVRGRVIGAVSGKGTAPQVFINGSLIGGLDDLKAHFA